MGGNSLGRSLSLEPVHQMSTPPYSVRYLFTGSVPVEEERGSKTYVYKPRAHALRDVHWTLIWAVPPSSVSASLKVNVSRTLSSGVKLKLKDSL